MQGCDAFIIGEGRIVLARLEELLHGRNVSYTRNLHNVVLRARRITADASHLQLIIQCGRGGARLVCRLIRGYGRRGGGSGRRGRFVHRSRRVDGRGKAKPFFRCLGLRRRTVDYRLGTAVTGGKGKSIILFGEFKLRLEPSVALLEVRGWMDGWMDAVQAKELRRGARTRATVNRGVTNKREIDDKKHQSGNKKRKKVPQLEGGRNRRPEAKSDEIACRQLWQSSAALASVDDWGIQDEHRVQ